VLATLNVVGGFVVTDRMLHMFRAKPADRKAPADRQAAASDQAPPGSSGSSGASGGTDPGTPP
jgi:H+-translocating NAD(P) transhydrogenase subunit alpha